MGISNSPQSPNNEQKPEGGISDFQISDQSLIKEKCHNSRKSDDIDIKLGPVTKLEKRIKTTSKKFKEDVMSASCKVIVISPIYAQSGSIRKPDSRRIVCKTYIFINSNVFHLTKTKNRAKRYVTQLSHYCYEQRYYFCQKLQIFRKKNADISKIKMVLVLKGIFSGTKYVCVLTY